MSTKELDVLRRDVLSLAESERAQLARDLVASLDGPGDSETNAAWDVEICRRINEIENGKAVLLDPEDVLSRARRRLQGA